MYQKKCWNQSECPPGLARIESRLIYERMSDNNSLDNTNKFSYSEKEMNRGCV